MADSASQPTDLADEATDAFVSAELPPPGEDEATTGQTEATTGQAETATVPVDGADRTRSMDATPGAAAPGNDDLLGELARAMHAAAT